MEPTIPDHDELLAHEVRRFRRPTTTGVITIVVAALLLLAVSPYLFWWVGFTSAFVVQTLPIWIVGGLAAMVGLHFRGRRRWIRIRVAADGVRWWRMSGQGFIPFDRVHSCGWYACNRWCTASRDDSTHCDDAELTTVLAADKLILRNEAGEDLLTISLTNPRNHDSAIQIARAIRSHREVDRAVEPALGLELQRRGRGLVEWLSAVERASQAAEGACPYRSSVADQASLLRMFNGVLCPDEVRAACAYLLVRQSDAQVIRHIGQVVTTIGSPLVIAAVWMADASLVAAATWVDALDCLPKRDVKALAAVGRHREGRRLSNGLQRATAAV